MRLTLCGERAFQTFEAAPQGFFQKISRFFGTYPSVRASEFAMKFTVRDIPPRAAWALEQAGVHPLLARLFAARGVSTRDELDDGLARLLPPSGLKGAAEAAVLLADAIAANKRLCIVADYDCDGATACAVGHPRPARARRADTSATSCPTAWSMATA